MKALILSLAFLLTVSSVCASRTGEELYPEDENCGAIVTSSGAKEASISTEKPGSSTTPTSTI